MAAPDYPRISDYPAHYARLTPARTAAMLDRRRLSYGALAADVERCARALLFHGVTKGDRIAMLSTPRPEYLTVFLATARIGALWMGLNPVHQPDEYRFVLQDCRPRLLFGFNRLRGRDNNAVLRQLKSEFDCIERLVVLDGTKSAEEISCGDFLRAGEGLPAEAMAAAIDQVSADDVALVVHTSGSSGQAKGAMITHRNLVHCARVQWDLFPLESLHALCNLPVNHVASTSDICSYTLVGGGTLVFQERFDPSDTLDLIEKARVSFLLQTPTMLLKLLEAREEQPRDTSSLQAVLFLGAAMARSKIAALQTLGGAAVTGWGMTETSCSVTYTDPADDLDTLANTVGRPAGCEIRIVDGDGRDVPAMETGEIVVRGACVMAGYYNRPEATRETIDAQGWLHSGDLGRFGDDGRLQLVGRIKDMFKSGGYNVYPREIEAVIESHPLVTEVAVVPVPDPLYQEVGFAFVRCRSEEMLGEAELDAYCRSRLANYKIPKRFVIRRELPLLPIGKIDKAALQQESLRLLAAEPAERPAASRASSAS